MQKQFSKQTSKSNQINSNTRAQGTLARLELADCVLLSRLLACHKPRIPPLLCHSYFHTFSFLSYLFTKTSKRANKQIINYKHKQRTADARYLQTRNTQTACSQSTETWAYRYFVRCAVVLLFALLFCLRRKCKVQFVQCCCCVQLQWRAICAEFEIAAPGTVCEPKQLTNLRAPQK